MKNKINYLDLFSGVGGFALGFQKAGFRFKNHYYSEVDKYAKAIYKERFPNSKPVGDVKKIGNELGKIDIITGGFPCQSFSVAGKGRGFNDPRGVLFFEVIRLTKIYRPQYLLLENVKNLLYIEKGQAIKTVLDELRRLDYNTQLILINSKDFGVPQNRERLFFICNNAKTNSPKISNIRTSKTENNLEIALKSKSQANRIYTQKLACALQANAGGQGGKTGLYLIDNQYNKLRIKTDYSPCLLSSQNKEMIKIFQNGIIRRLTPIECERLQGFPDNWTLANINNKTISDTQRYKCLGNAVTVNVIEIIAKELLRTINKKINNKILHFIAELLFQTTL